MRTFTRRLVVVVGSLCVLPSCSEKTNGLRLSRDAAADGPVALPGGGGASGDGAGGVGASGGLIGAGGAATGGSGSGGRTGSGGGTGGLIGSGGGSGGIVGSGGGTGGIIGSGGAGGGTSSCPMVPPCNWCSGTTLYDSNGCVAGFRCANGANPCTTSACPDSPCTAGYTCGSDHLCWPGTGGAGGGTGGAGGGKGGAGGISAGGAGGSRCQPLTCYNWCNGSPVTNSDGCTNGYRCENGVNPCNTSPCSDDSFCGSGYYCQNKMCWPGSGSTGGVRRGTGGAGGTGGMGGAGGRGGAGGGGSGGTTGTAQVGVRCDRALCNTGQVCCVSQSASTLTCTQASACTNDFAATCDGPEDCGTGQRCCIPVGALVQSVCGSCPPGQIMCHSGTDCPAGEHCCASDLFGAYAFGFCTTADCPPL